MQTDDSKRSRSAIRHVREWWERSQGATQAEMIRNQLALFDSNLPLAAHGDLYRIRSLASLAMLEGPESVIEETLNIAETLGPGRKLLLMLDPGAVLNAPRNRFAGNLKLDGDDLLPFRDGDWAMSDEELAVRVMAIEGDNRDLRIEVIKNKSVRHYRTQRAVLNALQKPETDAQEQILLLENLLQNPWPWHFPVLAPLLERDGDVNVRILAARCMNESLRGGRPYSDLTLDARLETNARGFEAARRVVQDDQNPEALRFAALDVLLRSRFPMDVALVRRLGESAVFDAHRGLTYRFEREEKVLQLLKKQDQWMQSRVPASSP